MSNRDLTIIIPAHIKDARKLAPCVNSLLENLYYVESSFHSTSKRADAFGSELEAFASSEALSVPSTCVALQAGRSGTQSCKTLSEAKFAEGTKIDNGGGAEHLSAKRADFRLTPYGLLARRRRHLLGYRSQMSRAHLVR